MYLAQLNQRDGASGLGFGPEMDTKKDVFVDPFGRFI